MMAWFFDSKKHALDRNPHFLSFTTHFQREDAPQSEWWERRRGVMPRQQVLSDGESAPEDAARAVGRRQSGEGAIPGRRAR